MSRTRVALLASLLVATSACTYSEHDRHHDDDWVPPPPQNDQIVSATIDTGATLAEIEPGRGAGAFVEYTSGGQWRIFTACDTELSGYGCTWDIIVSVDPDNSIDDFEDDQLEASDYLDWEDQHAVRFVTSTTYDFDGFFVEATEGAPLRVDVYLDDQPAPRYIYWVGEGALHRGAPSNPIDLIPSSL